MGEIKKMFTGHITIAVFLTLVVIVGIYLTIGDLIVANWLMIWPKKIPASVLEIDPQPASRKGRNETSSSEWWVPDDPDRNVCVRVDASIIDPSIQSTFDAYERIDINKVNLIVNGKKLSGDQGHWLDSNQGLRSVKAMYQSMAIPDPELVNEYSDVIPVDFCWRVELTPRMYLMRLYIDTEGLLKMKYSWAFRIMNQ